MASINFDVDSDDVLTTRWKSVQLMENLATALGQSVLGKTVPSVLDTALGLRPWAVSKTSGTVFPNFGPPDW